MKSVTNIPRRLVGYIGARFIFAYVVCFAIVVFEAAIFTSAIKVAAANDDGIPDLAHPLIAESPTPDTELRFEYIVINSATADELEVNPEGELAIMPGVSIEVDVPYKFRDPSDGGSSESNLDVTEIALKLAKGFDSRSLIGGGLELGLPTGDDGKNIGSNNELVVKPFLDVGIYQVGLNISDFWGLSFHSMKMHQKNRRKILGWNIILPLPTGLLRGLGAFSNWTGN